MDKIKTFIISFNRLSFLEQQVTELSKYSDLDLHIIDNGSTYAPLLKYLDEVDCNITFMPQNEGHEVVWEKGVSRFFCKDEPYIVTDNDILPYTDNWLSLLIEGLEKYPEVNKVGLGLRIDDLPVNIPFRDEIINHEQNNLFRQELNDIRFIKMPVDTTLALYRAGYHDYSIWGTCSNSDDSECKSIRTMYPNMARHLSWYLRMQDLQTEEYKYYLEHLGQGTGHWSGWQAQKLKRG